MENKKEDRFEITELFMVKAGKLDWHRRFLGTIKRGVDESGKPVISGRVQVNDSIIYAQAENEELLGEKLDEMALLILDMGLHSKEGVSTEIDGVKYFIN
jgi:hypothetical protein